MARVSTDEFLHDVKIKSDRTHRFSVEINGKEFRCQSIEISKLDCNDAGFMVVGIKFAAKVEFEGKAIVKNIENERLLPK